MGAEAVITGRDPDNDFEDAVIEGLRELNFECIPQVGVSNLYLDIGIRDPGSPSDFVAAIACDGASYQSSKSARDRDRLRQEILENLGWNIIRIWSTDWFRDPAGEIARVTEELQNLISAKAKSRRNTVTPERESKVENLGPGATSARIAQAAVPGTRPRALASNPISIPSPQDQLPPQRVRQMSRSVFHATKPRLS